MAERRSLHPGVASATIQLVQAGGHYRVLEDGVLEAEYYRSETLVEPEHCACDGNLMPLGHQAFRDVDRGYAISAEHCEVVENPWPDLPEAS